MVLTRLNLWIAVCNGMSVEMQDCRRLFLGLPVHFWVASFSQMLFRGSHKRVLVFNCTSGRSGPAFLSAIFNKITLQLKLHGSQEAPETYFDDVIFCTNVTYADGAFKGGQQSIFHGQAWYSI